VKYRSKQFGNHHNVLIGLSEIRDLETIIISD